MTVMLDDISVLESLGYAVNTIYQLISEISESLRDNSRRLAANQLHHLIFQTSSPVNDLLSSLQNTSDLYISLRPLDTGHSTRVDGTMTISDHRLPCVNSDRQMPTVASLALNSSKDIGCRKTYFFKLGDRRVRLTTSALIM